VSDFELRQAQRRWQEEGTEAAHRALRRVQYRYELLPEPFPLSWSRNAAFLNLVNLVQHLIRADRKVRRGRAG
jgi:hypothetical protein